MTAIMGTGQVCDDVKFLSVSFRLSQKAPDLAGDLLFQAPAPTVRHAAVIARNAYANTCIPSSAVCNN